MESAIGIFHAWRPNPARTVKPDHDFRVVVTARPGDILQVLLIRWYREFGDDEEQMAKRLCRGVITDTRCHWSENL